ncbi:MAG TPA: hypothetical protein VMF66_00145 [Candidatus Acidoferrum sp.]|nr:hypothetical protein [Candidatus Acidoferrum sp.]
MKSPITVGPKWTEIALPNSVVAKWEAQIVYATLASDADQSDHPLGLRSKDGALFSPELDLISDRSVNYALPLVGFRSGNDVEVIFDGGNIPRGTHFARLRMRSSKLVILGPITWFSYMPEDTKTGEP